MRRFDQSVLEAVRSFPGEAVFSQLRQRIWIRFLDRHEKAGLRDYGEEAYEKALDESLVRLEQAGLVALTRKYGTIGWARALTTVERVAKEV